MYNHHSTPKITPVDKNVVFITNCVWAVVYRDVAEDLATNCLHPGIQSDVDGKRQRLQPFKMHSMI